MHSSVLTLLLFVLLIVNSSSLHASEPEAVDLDGSIKQFVELTSDIHDNGFNKHHAITLMEIINQIDAEIDLRTKEVIEWEIEAQEVKREHMLMENELHRIEAKFTFTSEEAITFLNRMKLTNSTGLEVSKLLEENLDVAQSTIELSKRVRDHVYQELECNLKEGWDSKPSRSKFLKRAEQFNTLRRQVTHLRERAFKLEGMMNSVYENFNLNTKTPNKANDKVRLTGSKRIEL